MFTEPLMSTIPCIETSLNRESPVTEKLAFKVKSSLSDINPVGPCAPVGPVRPSDPVGPSAPAGPSDPVGPSAPAGPSDPVGPFPSIALRGIELSGYWA